MASGLQHNQSTYFSIENLSLADVMKNQHVATLHKAMTDNSQLVGSLWQEIRELRAEVEQLRTAGLRPGLGLGFGADYSEISYVLTIVIIYHF